MGKLYLFLPCQEMCWEECLWNNLLCVERDIQPPQLVTCVQAIKALKQTVEECWDHDAEARVSAVCVEERTREMASLWETRFKGLNKWTEFYDVMLCYERCCHVVSLSGCWCGKQVSHGSCKLLLWHCWLGCRKGIWPVKNFVRNILWAYACLIYSIENAWNFVVSLSTAVTTLLNEGE